MRFSNLFILYFIILPPVSSRIVAPFLCGCPTSSSCKLYEDGSSQCLIIKDAVVAALPSYPRVAMRSSRLCKGLARCARRSMAGRADTGVIDGYHINPMGDSDMPQRSRVSFLSEEMLEAKQIGVRGLSCYGFRMLDGSFLYGPVALFPKTALSWRVHTPDDITPQSLSLFALLEPKIDVLVLGVGDKKNIDKVRKQVYPFLREHKIGLELSDTEDAIATFNFLNSENRYVAAALYPPDDLIVSDAEYGRAMCLLKNWDELDENPLLSTATGEYDDLVRRVWGGKESWEEIKRALVQPKEMKTLSEGDEEKPRLK